MSSTTNESMYNTPQKNKNGKLLSDAGKKTLSSSNVVKSPAFEYPPSTALTASGRSLINFSTPLSPLLLSQVSQTLSLTSTKATLKKRLVLSDDNKSNKKPQRVQLIVIEPKLAAYNIDWCDSTATKNKCLKHTSSKNLPLFP
jgi:hypothetical protein